MWGWYRQTKNDRQSRDFINCKLPLFHHNKLRYHVPYISTLVAAVDYKLQLIATNVGTII